MQHCQTSIEVMHQAKIDTLVRERKVDDKGKASLSQLEIDYLLDAAPILQEHQRQQEENEKLKAVGMDDDDEMVECVLDGTMRNFIQVKGKTKDSATLTKLKLATVVEEKDSPAYNEARTC